MPSADVPDAAAVDRASELLAGADALVVAAGAGMGGDSGLPDFRGAQGFWRAYPALGSRQLRFEQVASPRTFETDAALAWGFYGHRLALYRRTAPHAGFSMLRRWGERLARGVAVFTSNVDGQFQRAGYDEAWIVECHGSIHWLQCSRPCGDAVWPADAFEPEVDAESCRLVAAPPACPRCGAVARPNILMFGDAAWLSARTDAQEDRLARWLQGVSRLVVVEIGAGTAVPSVRRFSQSASAAPVASLVRINPREPAVARQRDVSIAAGALAALEAIDRRLAG